MNKIITTLLVAIFVFVAVPTLSLAEEVKEPSMAPYQHRLVQETIVALRYNPIGLAVKSKAEYQYRLYESSEKAFEQNFIAPGIFMDVTPANIKIGPTLAIQPLSVLQVSAGYYLLNYFGSFDRVQSFTTLDADYSDDAQKENAGLEPPANYSASGSVLQLGGKFQIKAGPVAVRSTNRAMKFNLGTENDDPLFYESELDLMVSASGWAFQVDNDVLYFTDFGLMAGLRHTYATAFYPDDIDAGTGPATTGVNHRIGPFLAYRFHTDPIEKRSFYNEPTLVLLVNWYLNHTYRTGDDADGAREHTGSQAMPYIALAYRFTGDILDID
jgi:hypothetical protein